MDITSYEEWVRVHDGSHGQSASPITVEARVKFARRVQDWEPFDATTRTRVERFLFLDNKFSRATCAAYFSHFRSLFAWLRNVGELDHDPLIDMVRPTCPKGHPDALSAAEISVLRENLTGRVREWFLLGLLAGLRAHEIAKFAGGDITPDWVYVEGKGGKRAMIPTHPELWVLAETKPRSGYWYPTLGDEHISGSVVTVATHDAFRRNGIMHGSIHRARHTYGTNLVRSGANIRVVQTLMRHASIATTETYCAVDEDERRAAINRLVA